MVGTKGPSFVLTRLHQIRNLAEKYPDGVLTTLAHHIDPYFLYEAYARMKKDTAAGIDGVTMKEYEKELVENLKNLNERFKSGSYRAPAVRRTYIPKGDGRMRPLGIPTLEDRILQRAVTMVLNEVYELEFSDSSYGYRPGRSQHQCVEALRDALMVDRGAWVLEVDIKGYFDNVNPKKLREILDKRVRDGVIRRTINKWLKAGVQEEGKLFVPDKGVPQGGVISPLLSNIYLHEVLDKWVDEEVRPRLRGDVTLVRYADDFVLVFSREKDARSVWEVLIKRFARYDLELHPEKTRLVYFYPPTRVQREGPEGKSSRKIDFLGFTLHWGLSRRGNWVVRRKTFKKKLRLALKAMDEWCKANRHEKVRWQWEKLCQKLKGYYQYYGVTGNYRSLVKYYRRVRRIWKYWLNRRSQKRHMPWKKFLKLLDHYPLPEPRIVHSYYRT